MEQHGNTTTYNLETVLRQNLVNSEYYRVTCMSLASVNDVIDQIYYAVEHLEPWMSGNARGPSTAFCLLHRLFQLKPTAEEIQAMLDHEDSPYIRAIGFLYLRYVGDPKALWEWCSPYVKDLETLTPSPDGNKVTLGDYVRDILLEQYYFETIFPRIPKKVQDDIVEELRRLGLPTSAKGNGGAGGADRRGVDDGNKRPASVKASLSVAMGQRAPNRAGAREEGRGKDPSAARSSGRDDGGAVRDRDRDCDVPSRSRDSRGGGSARHGGSGIDRSRDMSRERAARMRSRSRSSERHRRRSPVPPRKPRDDSPPLRRRDDGAGGSGRDSRDVFREGAGRRGDDRGRGGGDRRGGDDRGWRGSGRDRQDAGRSVDDVFGRKAETRSVDEVFGRKETRSVEDVFGRR